ncbi:MAG: hypothetical protein AB7T38_02615 [Nitrospirales bacterium]
MKTVPLSLSMQAALEYAKRHGGELHRLPGGVWMNKGQTGTSFGASTIRALVARGWMAYSEWQPGRRGRTFPIAVTVANERGS